MTESDPLPPSLARFALDDIRAGDILGSHTRPSGPRAVGTRLRRPVDRADYVVVDKGEPLGTVSLRMLRHLPKESWSGTRLDGILKRDPPVALLDEPVEDVLQRMTERSLTVMPVTDRESGKFVGTVTSQEILDLIVAQARGEH